MNKSWTVGVFACAFLEGIFAGAQPQDPKGSEGGQPKTEIYIYGAGDYLADPGNTTASRVRGQVGVHLRVPETASLAVSFNATDAQQQLSSDDRADFGSALIATELGPYSFGIDTKFYGLSRFGGFLYGRASAYEWHFVGENEEGLAVNAIPWAAGLGLLWAYDTVRQNDNKVYLDIGMGAAFRGVGGDVSQDGQIATFLGREPTAFGAAELRAALHFNSVRGAASVFYFPVKNIDGVSNVRLIVSVGVAGDALKL